MNNKTLSIIVPNYNKGIYINELIESILRQTRLPDEIIIVDDCSTDDSKEILLEIAKRSPIIKLFFLEKNSGVQYARNFGASKATCFYITFIDSDDFYYDSNKIHNEMKCAGPNKLVTSRFYFYNNANKTLVSPDYDTKSYKHYLRHQKYYLIMNKYVPFFPYAYIIPRKAFVKVGGYDFKYDLFEDVDILIKLKMAKVKFIYLKTYGRAYRTNDNATEHLSYVDSKKILLAKDELKRKYLSNIKFHLLYMNFYKKIKSILKKR